MTPEDLQLLKAAARAARLRFKVEDGEVRKFRYDWVNRVNYWFRWNPLVDPADAFELAATLGIDIEHNQESRKVYASTKHSLGAGTHGYVSYQGHEVMTEPYGSDPVAAMKRAIVRSAAALKDRK